ncbi:ubiquitin carboxyl-terminal hydrolase 8-like isoform X1 [Mizuhopecten yessoensis]|uniref:ubiquitin carboxyl-terminal hydrolase 8-like isoform X1 n=2 Tax=Mizuhopecten yessoensis TaxID=6573 RepID=UPI000B457D5E|nr:ubiquitin carboxyl-terminal hydrolase 8-like isoform X1 [Mizuhopecten yessoensis]XP_021379460.1 ubiquitin carboxyl-terminal hydrolase 8-like isoform X1 [Mizuhopecten yessoensis]
MPGRTVKDVYMATSMTDLNKLVDISKQKLGNNPRLLIKTSDTMLKGAEECDLMGDEEKAYVLFMRFFNIITAVKKMPEYRKQKDFYDKLIGQKNVLKCMDKAEDLSKSLKNRYDYCEAQEIAKKLSTLDSSSPEEKKVDKTSEIEADKNSDGGEKTKTQSKESTPDPVSAPPPQPEGQITPVQLFSLLKESDEQMAIMDVRPAAEFEESHIQHRTCINVPAEIVSPGTTVTVIEKTLPEDSRSLWQQRGHLDHIVLVDWSSTLDKVTIGTTLRTLKDALFKYDSTVIIRSEPVVLEGGYDQWLYHYPQLTTNPHIKHSSVSTITSAPSLDFDYPDDINVEDILNPKKTPAPEKSTDLSDSLLQFAQGMTDQSGPMNRLTQVNGDIGGVMPRIDRSTKPRIGTNQNTTQDRPITFVTGSDLYPSVSRSLNGSERSNTIPESKGLSTDDAVSLETKSNSALSKYSEELEKEKSELERIRQQKAEELASFQKEKERIAKERESRIERMKSEEDQLSKMEQMKAVQAKDLADLLRKKKKLEEDIKRETTAGIQDEKRKYQEEEARKVELIRVRQEEEEKKRRMEEVMRLREERKRKETDGQDAVNSAQNQAKQIEEENKQKLREASERAEKLRQEKERKKLADSKDKEEREKAAEAARQRDQERREREAQAQIDAQRRQQEELKRQKEDRDKQEIYRQDKEREERERKLQDEKSRADLALRLAQDKMKQLNDKPQVRTIPSPNLPEGWEKKRDNKTGRYFYVDHKNSLTQWEPPFVYQPDLRKDSGIQDPLRTPQRGMYKTKLKDESEQGRSGGLKRSFSSPDITKLMEEETLRKPDLPSVDRSKKPTPRVEPRPQPASTRPRNLNPTYGNVGSALTGLRNLGNTCYMNSIIQCLDNCAPLVQYFLTDRYLYDINRDGGPDSYGYQVVDEFVVIVKALWSGQYRNITPRDFKYIVGKYQPMFAGCDQQDSQEFLTFVLDGLNEGLNKVKEKPKLPDTDNDKLPEIQAAAVAWRRHCLMYQSIIVDLFQGMLRSTLTCLTCKHKSVTFEVFMYLSLPIPSGSRCSLQDCLQEFLKVEKMTGSSRWKCPNCRVQRDTEKKIDIWKLPPLLIIALNRFVWEGMWRQKINSYVDFPVNDLSLEKFTRGPGTNPHYQLYGVSNHYGTMDGGHYTAYCKNAVSKKWYKFDDHEVFDMSSSEVKTSAGFVLFYTTMNFTAPTYRQPF